MTETELTDHGIGTTIHDPKSAEWAKKRIAYKICGVWDKYLDWEVYFRFRCKTPVGDFDHADRRVQTQAKIDNHLLKVARGEPCKLGTRPKRPDKKKGKHKKKATAVKAAPKKETDLLMDLDEFIESDGKIDMIETITYLFENMNVKDIKPKEAPSRGAYFWLMKLRDSPEAQTKFYESGIMKLVPSSAQLKEAGTKNDDGRDTFELLDRLLQECSNSQGKVPVL